MSKTIKFTVVPPVKRDKDGKVEPLDLSKSKVIGTATLSDDNQLTTSNAAVASILAPMQARLGDEPAFEMYIDWSNGYIRSELVDGKPAPLTSAAVVEGKPVKRWRGTIAPFNEVSGDKRLFRWPGEWSFRDLPRPVSFQRADGFGHDGAVTVGRITDGSITEAGISADGDWLASVDETTEAQELLANSVLYPSVDLDDYEFIFETPDGRNLDDLTVEEFEEMMISGVEPIMVFTKGRVGKVTFLGFEAFPQTTLEMYEGPASPDSEEDEDEDIEEEAGLQALTAAATGDTGLPVAPRDHAWDGSGAASRMLDRAKGGGEEADPAKLAQGHFYRDDDGDAALGGSYKLPFADVIDGELKMVYAGVTAAAARFDQTQMPDDQRDAVKSKINGAYAACAKAFDDDEIKPPWDDAALVASGKPRTLGPVYPPEAWFGDPALAELTPITVKPDGRVFGHLTDKDCHLSFLANGQCVLPPEEGGFEWFHRSEIETAEGTYVRVAAITANARHADLSFTAAKAISHYENTALQVAIGRAGRDKFGTWFAGSIVPEATEAQVQLLRRSPVSGDWRIVGGKREMIAALCVNVPGFPVVRGRVSHGRAITLTASGWRGWKPTEAPVKSKTEELIDRAVARAMGAASTRAKLRREADKVAATIGRDPRTVAEELAVQVHAGG